MNDLVIQLDGGVVNSSCLSCLEREQLGFNIHVKPFEAPRRRNSRVVGGTKRERMLENERHEGFQISGLTSLRAPKYLPNQSLGGGYTVGVHLEHYFRGLRGEGKCGIFSINILQGEMSCRFRHRAAGSRDNVGTATQLERCSTVQKLVDILATAGLVTSLRYGKEDGEVGLPTTGNESTTDLAALQKRWVERSYQFKVPHVLKSGRIAPLTPINANANENSGARKAETDMFKSLGHHASANNTSTTAIGYTFTCEKITGDWDNSDENRETTPQIIVQALSGTPSGKGHKRKPLLQVMRVEERNTRGMVEVKTSTSASRSPQDVLTKTTSSPKFNQKMSFSKILQLLVP
ncbi:hypothetical protein B0H16DRAFT_1686179 [Mycena metata]|uniref:Uncharacterized protein n=1 Tax=Mycena metata TaxID=1033252 RepID=A0AAD7JPQ6_9AGAR|nr:hypothetical protein B0H16DRAFT_1686179 [Mycena metata]